jgi:molybdate transport system permease protein
VIIVKRNGGNKRKKTGGKLLAHFLMALTAAVMIAFILLMVLPLVSLVQFSGFKRLLAVLNDPTGVSAIVLSLKTTGITTVLTLAFGIPVSFVLSRFKKKRIIKLASFLCQLPISLPPSVAGIALLLLFGKNGMVGRALSTIGVQLIFTPVAVVIAQFFVSCPLFIQIMRTAADDTPEELYEVALVNGADYFKTIACYIIPMLRVPLVSAIVVSYIRSLGEFGATLLFAGNMSGVTSTMPLHIYSLMESDVRLSAAFAFVLISIATVIVVAVKTVFGHENK